MAISSTPVSKAWEDALSAYHGHAQAKNLNTRTIRNRRSAILGLARWLEAEHGINDPAEVTAMHMQLAMAKAFAERQKSGPRTHYNDLRAFFSWFAKIVGTDNPMNGLTRPKDIVTPVRVLTPAEIKKLLDTARGRDYRAIRDSAIAHVFLETGLRRDELAQLDYSDLNLKAKTLTVRHGKGGTFRTVGFGPLTAEALYRLIRIHPGGDGALFTNSNGNRLTGQMVGIIVKKLGDAAGISGLHPHALRHSWAHYARAGGIQDSDMMTLGGWSSPTQLQRYGAFMKQERALVAAHAAPVLSVAGGK